MTLVTTAPLATAAAATATGACVIPVPLELEENDAGPTSPPVILSASPPELAFPGPITLELSDQRRLGLTVRDQDREDTLYIRFFVNYTDQSPTSTRADCVVPPPLPLSETRVADCSIANICREDLVGSTEHFLEAMVADREFLPDNDPRSEGQPAFRALPADAAYSFRSWKLICQTDLGDL
jgi:hypothetical protein